MVPAVFGLYLILTEPLAGYEVCAAAAVCRGVRYLQLRMKNQARERVLKTARQLREITRGTGTYLIVNDDLELACEVDADGLHLGQHDLPLAEARQRWPTPGKQFGLSTHSLKQARQAGALRPDYIGVGPVFATPTKVVPDPVLGLWSMAAIIRSSALTTVAIGGIDRTNLAQVLRYGASNFCVVRAVNQRRDPEAAIRELQEIWENRQTR